MYVTNILNMYMKEPGGRNLFLTTLKLSNITIFHSKLPVEAVLYLLCVSYSNFLSQILFSSTLLMYVRLNTEIIARIITLAALV